LKAKEKFEKDASDRKKEMKKLADEEEAQKKEKTKVEGEINTLSKWFVDNPKSKKGDKDFDAKVKDMTEAKKGLETAKAAIKTKADDQAKKL
jgi:hypothetical protein